MAWEGEGQPHRGTRAAPTPYGFTHTSYQVPASPVPYQHEVLVPLQFLHSPGQALPFLLPGLILQAPELLIALLLPSGFVLDLAQGNH